MKRLITTAAAVATLALVAPPGMAGATPKDAQAQILGTVVIQEDGTARVTARYTCPEGFHLWVSAKQSESGRADERLTEEGSSRYAAAWLQSHPTSFTCDGKWHTGTFAIDTAEQGWGELQDGRAWVQFCLIGESVFLSESRWVTVR